MARKQNLVSLGEINIPVPNIGTPVANVSTLTKSVLIQSKTTNSDLIYILDSNGNVAHSLEPGNSVEINGDNLDNGTGGYLDLREIFLDAEVNGSKAIACYLDNQ